MINLVKIKERFYEKIYFVFCNFREGYRLMSVWVIELYYIFKIKVKKGLD